MKGGWENDETVEEAAVREAIEEAGVRGDLMVKNIMLLNFLSSVVYFVDITECLNGLWARI